MSELFGLDSAIREARKLGKTNMLISTELVLDLAERIAGLEAEKEAIDECGSRNDRNNFDIIAKQDKRITELERERDELSTELIALTLATGRTETWALGEKLLAQRDLVKILEATHYCLELIEPMSNSVQMRKAIQRHYAELRKQQEGEL